LTLRNSVGAWFSTRLGKVSAATSARWLLIETKKLRKWAESLFIS